MINKKAEIHPEAKIGKNIEIGPWTVIGPQVEIGDNTWIGPHVVIDSNTKIGCDNKIYQFASVGAASQDKKYQGEETYLEIGDRNIIREFTTINRGTVQDNALTLIGNDNLFMAYVHIAHDCKVGNHTVFSNNATIAGHVKVDDYVVFGGFSATHQHCHIGAHSFATGGAIIIKDVPPYIRVAGMFAEPFGINTVGLRRRDFSPETIQMLRKAYKILYRQGLTVKNALESLKEFTNDCKEAQLLVDFLESSTRGIVR